MHSPAGSPARNQNLVRLLFRCLLFFGFVSVGQFSAQDASLQNSPTAIRGIVVNAVTHAAISRALVSSVDNRFATMTDSEGRFEFALPKSDDENGNQGLSISGFQHLSLTARKPGYLDDRNEGKWTQATPGDDVTISLTPEALIKGRITLPSGDSVRGVNVQLYSRQVQDGTPHWRMMSSAQANSNGEFRFAELRPGAYKLFTLERMDNDPNIVIPGGQLYGFPPVYYPNATDFAAASLIQLTAGQIFQADLSLLRQPYYPVKIPVANAEENNGLNVTVSPQGQRGPGYTLGYNRVKGTIEGQLPDGKYLVEGVSYARQSAGGIAEPGFSSSGVVNISVAGAAVAGPPMVVARDNSIVLNVREQFSSGTNQQTAAYSGRIYSRRGQPINLDVTAQPVEDFGAQRVGSLRPPIVPNDDSLVLENLMPGKYWLRLLPTRGYVASVTMGGVDLLREPLVVVAGASSQIDVTLRDDTAEIEGSLILPAATAGSTESSSGTQIYCIPLPDSSGQFLIVSPSSDGKFDSQGVVPGAYRVIAFDGDRRELPYRDPEAMKAYESKGQVVHLEPGAKATLQLQPIQDTE